MAGLALATQAEATKQPKTVRPYEGVEHELTFRARLDRIAWLREQFKIRK